jgi:HEPN domain-containing protein
MGAVVWGHSVADLLEELAQQQVVPEYLRDAALELDKSYILSRYPDAHPSGSPRRRYIRAEAERLVEYAAQIVEFCEGLLSTLEP